MKRPRPDISPAALREQIQRAGADVLEHRARGFLWAMLPMLSLLCLPMAALCASVGYAPPAYGDTLPEAVRYFYTLAAAGGGLTGLVGVGCLSALGAAATRRHLYERRLCSALRPMPSDQRAAVLLPLRAHPTEDVRKIVSRLIRDVGLPGEVSPALEGRGDEVTPAPSA
jgi:hypothetical protein